MGISVSLKNAIQDYRNGDKEAFTIIYQESEKYIYSSIYRVAKGNHDAIDMTADVMGDTYLEISQSFEQLRDDEKFFSWAGTIATRKCYAYIKKNKREVLLGEDDTTFEQLADDDNIIPEEVMQNREAQRLLREIIDRDLNEMQKLCIVGVYYNQQKQSEIARELGIPENTVKTHLSRAKAKIKAGVEELHIKKGTKLYSVAPLFLLLFKEDVQACVVPAQVGAKVLGAVGTSAGTIGAGVVGGASKGGVTGIKGLFSKIAGASAKAKIAGAVVAVGIAGATTGAIVHNSHQEATTWQEAYTDYLVSNEDGVDRFDLHDFDGDGSPELVGSNELGDYWLFTYKNNEFKSVATWITDEEETVYDRNGGTHKIRYGYGLNEDEIVRVDDGTIIYDDGTSRRIQGCWIFNYENDKAEPNKYYKPDYHDTPEKSSFGPDTCSYAVGENGNKTNWDLDEGQRRVQEIIFNQYVAINYTMLDDDTISQSVEKTKEASIAKRMKEFDNMGNRKPVPFGLQF